MIEEVFAKPAARAIIEKEDGGASCILLQRRQKEGGGQTNGLIELAGGKIREYENVFDALRREVWEETGLTVTKIEGEEKLESDEVNGVRCISFEPFCTVQNLNGVYSLMVHAFICRAEGEPVSSTEETQDIHWEKLDTVQQLVERTPEKVFSLDLMILKKYLKHKR